MTNPETRVPHRLDSTPVALPDLTSLTRILARIFDSSGLGARIEVILRERNLPSSYFPSEIVTCRFQDGSTRRVLCKYGMGQAAGERRHRAHGHRGGLLYEAAVYRQVLETEHFSVPRYWGDFQDPRTGLTGLVLEYLEKAVRLDETPDLTALILAAQWIGRFHAAADSSPVRPAFLFTYDAHYFKHWGRRTLRLAHELQLEFPWLAPICRQFGEFIPSLLTAPLTIIHGEFYPGNILVSDGIIYPIDWESAAIGAGEIDLASLTEGWPEEIVRRCEQEYERSRWPAGTPPAFRRALDAARLYQHFRWLGAIGDELELTHETERFNRLHALAKHLGLLA